MTKKLSLLIMASMMWVCIISPGYSFAQALVWKNFSCMYNVNGITADGGNIWAATSGGVFSYSPITQTFHQFTTTEGLSNIQATSIISDSGNIFVGEGDGTIDELNSSGSYLRSQTDIKKSSFLSKQVIDLILSGDTLFACTPFGVTLVSKNTFVVLDSYLHFVPGQTTAQANSVAIFAGNIYAGSRFGLSVAPRSAENLSAPDLWQFTNASIFSSGVNALEVLNGSLIVGSSQGLYYSTDGTTFLPISGPDYVKTLTLAGNSILVNSQNGLSRLNSDHSITPISDNGSVLQCVLNYSDTLIVAGTSRGLLSIGSSIQTILPPGPATNIINHLSVDAKGNLWCATTSPKASDLGVAYMKFDGTTWKNFSAQQNPVLPTNWYFEISAISGNEIVAGSWGSGMALLNEDGSVKKIFNSSNSPLVSDAGAPGAVIVGDAASDASGNIWVVNKSAYNGNILAVYSPEDSSWYSFNDPYSLPAGFISIAIDAYGGVWTGGQFTDVNDSYDGVFYYNANGTLSNTGDDHSLPLTKKNGLLDNQINALVVDNENQVWIGTASGLNVVYDPSNPSYISTIYLMLDQNILGVDYDALDDKWVSTNSGVYELSKDGNTRDTLYDMTNSPLPSNTVSSVACDRVHGIVYFVTDYGVTQLKMGVVQPQTNFSKIKVFPNPVRFPIKENGQVQIVGLVADSQIKIFSISGKMVRSLQAQGGNIAYWDGRDDHGELLPSGIYIIIAYTPDGTQSAVTKVAVIR
jgi:ligand-binding sensor domain-containing protein